VKTIETRNQPILGFGKTIRITVDGIRYRLFRSIVTVAVVAVAVAFLMNILSEGIIKTAISAETRESVREMRLGTTWKSRLTRPEVAEEIVRNTAQEDMDAALYRQVVGMTGTPDAEMQEWRRLAGAAVVYLDFFADLSYGQSRRLVGRASGTGIFDSLQDEAEMSSFREELRTLKSVQLVTSEEDFETFLEDWPALLAFAREVQQAQREAIAKTDAYIRENNTTLTASLEDEEFARVVRDAGFVFDEDTASIVTAQVKRMRHKSFLDGTIKITEVRKLMAREDNVMPEDVTVDRMWQKLSTTQGATWYLTNLVQFGIALEDVTPEDAVGVAREAKTDMMLRKAAILTENVGRGPMGMGENMAWLVFVSMVVCVVGICNAMLMSVTERFREIATLKCLGALDGFIMLMFVLEAAFLGVVGGMAGAIAGCLIGALRMTVSFGPELVSAVPVLNLVAATLLATVLGVILAAIASVYPSFKAARLAPMEAMRIE
jgi:hypothetical protein